MIVQFTRWTKEKRIIVCKNVCRGYAFISDVSGSTKPSDWNPDPEEGSPFISDSWSYDERITFSSEEELIEILAEYLL